MAVRFSDRECNEITTALRQAAARHAAAEGMRRTTVDQLAEEAGISKGAFYKFYPAKEYLFLDMLEQWYKQVSHAASEALSGAQALPPKERASVMFKAAIRTMWATPLASFLMDDVPLLLRKIPEDMLREHYQSNVEFIHTLVRDSGIRLAQPEPIVFAAIHMLFLSQLTADQIGPAYEPALSALIDGAVEVMVEGC